jgi:hypothetical protein
MRYVSNPDHVIPPVLDEKWALGGLELSPSNNWDVSTPGFARFRYNSITNRLEVSANGGPYYQVGTSTDYDVYRAQTTWYIDSDLGNDGHDGLTAVTALRTFDEFRRRHGGMLGSNAAVTVYLDGAGGVFTGDVTVDMAIKPYPSPECLYINGTSTSIYSGSVTAYQAYNSVASEEPIITDAAIPISWTASGLVGKRIELTSGVNDGKSGWTFKDLGTKQVRSTIFFQYGVVGTGEPSINNTFTVWEMTHVVGNLSVDVGAGGTVKFFNLVFDNTVAGGNWINSGFVSFVTCQFIQASYFYNYGAELRLINCYVNGWFEGRSGWTTLSYGCMVGPSTRYYSYVSHSAGVVGPTFFQGDGADVYLHQFGSMTMGEVVFLDNTSVISIFCSPGSKLNASGSTLWGKGNTYNYAIYLDVDAAFYVSVLPAIDGAATSDTRVGGDNKTFAEFAAGYIQAENMARSLVP